MKIVIVGGGAGGLELATRLGQKLGLKHKAEVVLIDRNPTHLWKPLLHEVAAGSLDAEVDAVSYRAHGYRHGFQFKLGEFSGLDRERQVAFLAPYFDDEGEEVLPRREENYDTLVLAIGSICNDFRIPGVAEHCRFLDASQQAIRFHRRLVHQFIQLNRRLLNDPGQRLHIAIVGGGATGVELAAELFNAREQFSMYGLERVQEHHLKVTLVEAGPRLLPALTGLISDGVLHELQKLGVDVRLNTQVARAEKGALITSKGARIEANTLVWAAGIKAPDYVAAIPGLETNRLNQVLVRPTLQSTTDDAIYVIGDCAGLKLGENGWVPPRAQTAHQMASLAAKNILRGLRHRQLVNFSYRDHGSLVSLSRYSTLGVLMGNLRMGTSLNLRGWLARMAYQSLYRMHQVALHGWLRAGLVIIADRINHIIRPRLKLH